MALWKLAPATRSDDPRWQGRRIWREVIVRADSAALARVLAMELERDPDAAPTGNESLSFASGFEDEKLYWAMELDPAEAAAFGGGGGQPGILHVGPTEEAAL